LGQLISAQYLLELLCFTEEAQGELHLVHIEGGVLALDDLLEVVCDVTIYLYLIKGKE
jgi:hypothetical protein